jgi:hypothetical protein
VRKATDHLGPRTAGTVAPLCDRCIRALLPGRQRRRPCPETPGRPCCGPGGFHAQPYMALYAAAKAFAVNYNLWRWVG